MLSRIHPAIVPVAASATVNYEDCLLNPLPTIIVQRTLAATICGQGNSAAFNANVIAITQRVEVLAHVAVVLVLATGLPLFVVADLHTRRLLTGLHVLPGLFCFVYMCASLSSDMLRLMLRTFEFWFLSVLNVVNTLSWSLLFHDTRVIPIVLMGSLYAASLCVDAATYTRHFVARAFFLSSPTLFTNLALAAAKVPPDFHYQNYTVCGVEVDAIDVLVNGNLAIAYFTTLRVLRLRHLVFSTAPIQRIQCGMYYPYSRLSPQLLKVQDTAPPEHQKGTDLFVQQLNLEDSFATRDIDITQVVSRRVTELVGRFHPRRALLTLGVSSHLMVMIGGCWSLTELTPRRTAERSRSQASFVFSIVGFVGGVIFSTIYLAHCQRQLVTRVLRELDAWFVFFQMTVVTVGFCDLVAWDFHLMLPLLAAWIWCHWTVFLDAVPPVTRRHLGHSPSFTRSTCFLLMTYPVALAYTLYVSHHAFRERDRVLIELHVGGVQWQIRLRGFLASKLFTLEVWLVRFLWREMARPRDAFMLIKRHVYYEVSPPCTKNFGHGQLRTLNELAGPTPVSLS